jgi:hypothetical protein
VKPYKITRQEDVCDTLKDFRRRNHIYEGDKFRETLRRLDALDNNSSYSDVDRIFLDIYHIPNYTEMCCTNCGLEIEEAVILNLYDDDLYLCKDCITEIYNLII